MRKFRTRKEIKFALDALEDAYYAERRVLQKELDAAIKRFQDECPHPKNRVRIKSNGYMEEGRMRSPVEWEEAVCKRCGKTLATSSTETKTIWHEVEK